MKRVGAREVWSLADVTKAIWKRFDSIPPIWLEADVQNLRPSGGQVYFTLAGGDALDASMNRIVFDRLAAPPAEGARVHAYGQIEFYRRRSQVSMRVERLELAGDGLLRAQVAELRRRLDAEGLLAPGRKRALPLMPCRVGLVTSAAGAAREDVLRALWARFPQADVLEVDVPVQGDAAPPALARAIAYLDAVSEVEVMILARGGGSLEDLMAFNSELVCRAIAAAGTPVVSAVGHERDTTLCDAVADLRVSTPTAAAAAVVPDRGELDARLARADGALAGALTRARAGAAAHVDARGGALAQALRSRGARAGDRIEAAGARLAPGLVRARARARADLGAAEDALARAVRARREQAVERCARAESLLGLLSPARTVARGYAIVRDAGSGAVVASAAAARPGQGLAIELRDGRLGARVTERP